MSSKKIMEKKLQIPDHVNHEKASEIFKNFSLPDSSVEMAHKRLDDILKCAKTIEEDIGTENDDIVARLAAFERFLVSVKEVDAELEKLHKPTSRHRKDLTSLFYSEKVGLGEFRREMSYAIAKIFDYEFLRKHQIDFEDFCRIEMLSDRRSSKWVTVGREERQISQRIPELAEAMDFEIIPITRSLLKSIAKGLEPVVEKLEQTKSRKGRKKRPLVINFIILNIVGLWVDAFNGKKAVYVDEKYRDLFNFTRELWKLFGPSDLCTEDAIRDVIPIIRERSR